MSDEVVDRVTKLRVPVLGLTRYINVRQRVGPNERNQEVDIRIVAALLALTVAGKVKDVDIPRNIRDSKFNASVGFWIFHFQLEQFRARRTADVDGVVSPSNDMGRYPGGFHTIVLINAEARARNPKFFEDVCDGKVPLTQVD